MEKFFLVITFIFSFSSLFSKETPPSKLCNSFSDCSLKANKTDIYRKKISLYEEALKLFKKSDGEVAKIKVHLFKANAIIREAQGDTGYKGEIPVKVSHKPEYKDAQFQKAEFELKEVEKKLTQLQGSEQELYEELSRILQSE